MRKLFYFLLFFPAVLHAQQAKNWELGMSVGTANNYYKTYVAGVGIGARITADAELKTWDKLSFRAGGTFAYARTDATYRMINPDWSSKYIWQNFLFALRGTFVRPIDERLDVYAGLHLGLRFLDFKEKYSVNPPAAYVPPEMKVVNPHLGAYAGVNCKLNKRTGLFGEVGFDMIWFNVGIKFKLNPDEE